jgi:two-component system chemotaxis response regulator CheB
VLTVQREGPDQLLFECRVGHAFSPEELIADKEKRVELLLWSSVVALEELSALLRDLGGDGERARRALAEAVVVRHIIEATVPARLEVSPACTGDGEG